MARRNFGRRTLSRARRATAWAGALGIPTALGSCASDATLVFGSLAISDSIQPVGTIVRIRGMIHVEIATETAASVLQAFGIGIGLFTDSALAVSTGAGAGIPGPLDDPDSEEWMWIHYGFLGQGPDLVGEVTNESDGTGRRMAMDIPVDCKAMRKWDDKKTLVWKIQNDPIDGTATEIDITAMARILIKTPA